MQPKFMCNKIFTKHVTECCLQDVGQAVLESYSRVLEGLAFNIVAWIDDVVFVDKTMKSQE